VKLSRIGLAPEAKIPTNDTAAVANPRTLVGVETLVVGVVII
jgi:hypothetical protein